ncbi:class I SAM-dependent methyltransferase [Paenibacillus oenotherae]|uniref:Class I SAM-dependent methyltransferase n=1 Tax=Paenibacillus oenotherae TaxID=1435645 RepID=A0ABS7D7S4_9BACL|nr:class I SAM-dependent methyltransferase [Paenibacillus oenotherae]MBW7475869.1 class I SAM-dependent methyltransferase [Paenibacillus oenotherae]
MDHFRGRHKYNPEHGARGAALLNHFLRRWFASPVRMLNDIGAGSVEGEVWADIGCGNGFFTIPIASRVAKVHAVDISPAMLGMLNRTLQSKRIDNVIPSLSEENRIPIGKAEVDVAFLAYVVHELDTPEQFFRSLAPILKPTGRVIIIEFSNKLSFGPPMNERISPEQADRYLGEAGLLRRRTWTWSRSAIGLEYSFLP